MPIVTEERPGLAMRIIRSIAAVIAGSVTIGITAFGADAIIRRIVPNLFATAGQDGDPKTLLFILLYTALFAMLGGYVTAWVAKTSPMKHVIALALLQMIGGIAAVSQAGDALPRWYAAAALAYPIPVICLGGYLRSRKRQT